MKVGACVYCGGGPLTPDHECLQMRVAKMTDEKDWFEKVKDNVKLADRLGYWPFDKNSNNFTAEMKRLIQEIEKLREENQLYNLASNFDQVLGQAERIEELEAENAECREALKHEVDLNAMNLRQCEKLKTQLSESQKRVKELGQQNIDLSYRAYPPGLSGE